MSDTPDQRLAATAHNQAGVFTRTQALACGFSPGRVSARLTSGQWVVIHPSIYCSGTTRQASETQAVAGLLHCGDEASFSHFTAARLLGIDLPAWSHAVWILVPHEHRVRSRAGLIVSRTRHWPSRMRVARGYPVTCPARTIVDLAQVLNQRQLTHVLHDVVRQELVHVDQVTAILEGLGNRAGTGNLRSVMKGFDSMYESGLEIDADEHFRAAGIHLERQVEIWEGHLLIARLDFADEELKLAVEIDGFRYHSTMTAQERDKRRDRALQRRGWTVLRFTTGDVHRRPQQMVTDVLQQVAMLSRCRPAA